MQVPRLEKIVLNCGVGRATQQQSLLDGAVADLTVITGQKPLVTRAKKSIAGFKLREGNAIGAKVTLRGDRMWEFYDRLVSIAIPRIRDFRGLNPNSFDGRGQLHLRRHRAADLPGDRLRQDRHRPRHGHHHRHDAAPPTTRAAHSCARSGSRSAATSRARGNEEMAKKALVQKQQRTPKFKVRGYTRCRRCGRAALGVQALRPLPDLLPQMATPARSPA